MKRRRNTSSLKWVGNDVVDKNSLKKTKSGNEINKEKTLLPFENVNPNLFGFPTDYLYHLNLDKKHDDLKSMFGDVKFVCLGGTARRMQQFAHYIKDIIGYKMPIGMTFENITASTDRYSMYKAGPVLSVNHGIGCPSMSILLNELMKLVLYAGCKDVTFFRMGTCGGIGSKPGSLVITEEAVDGMFRPEYRQIVLGKEIIRKTKLDIELAKELIEIADALKNAGETKIEDVIIGRTLCAHDFYEGQGRVDGIFCDYDIDDKMEFLKKCKENNVINIEMESAVFAAYTNYAKIKSAIICVTIVDRLNGDLIAIPHDLNLQYQERPFKLVGEYIKRHYLKNE